MSCIPGRSEGAPQPLEPLQPNRCKWGLRMAAVLVYGALSPPEGVPPSLHSVRGSSSTERSWGPAEPDLDILS